MAVITVMLTEATNFVIEWLFLILIKNYLCLRCNHNNP